MTHGLCLKLGNPSVALIAAANTLYRLRLCRDVHGCSRVLPHTSPSAFQKPSAPAAMASSGATSRPRRFRSSNSSFHDSALSRTPSASPIKFLLALWRRADDDEDALGVVFQPGLEVDAIGPEVDIALGRQIAVGAPSPHRCQL